MSVLFTVFQANSASAAVISVSGFLLSAILVFTFAIARGLNFIKTAIDK